MKVRLTQEEGRLLGKLASQVGVTFNAALHRWQGFVAEVQRGYDDNIYEYTNCSST